MFEISVESSFHAQHAVKIQGVEELPHFHDWKVVVQIGGPKLNEDGVLIDFLELEENLKEILSEFQDSNLNLHHCLGQNNPSAENVAKYIGNCIQDCIEPPNMLTTVTVTEAPNCKAIYHP